MNKNILHPFVKIHIVDMETGKYLAKSDKSKPGVYNKESVQLMTKDGDESVTDDKLRFQEYAIQESADFLLPMATTFFDMRIKGQNSCQWNQEFIINEKASHLF